jgi:hypothetical protein
MATPATTGASNDVAALNGNFKRQYASKLVNALPDGSLLQKRIEFTRATKLGDDFATMVNISHEGGVSYLGEGGAVQALADAIAGQTKQATVKGTELNLRAFISYKALAASLGGDEKAFKNATAFKVFDMNSVVRKRLEISMWYGQDSIGVVSSVTDLGSNLATVVITDASFAPGFWQGVEGHRLASYTSGGTRHSDATSGLKIVSVDLENKTLTVSYVSAVTEVQAADTLHWFGSRTGSSTYNEMVGLKKILSNTGSLFGIDASTASVWKGNLYPTAGQPSIPLLQRAAVKPANRGCMGKLLAVIPTKAWAEMSIEEGALVRRTQSESNAVSGFDGLRVRAANGELEIVPSPFVKEGDFFLLPEDEMLRVGAIDVTFSLDGERFFRYLDGYNGYELQCMCDQAIFINKPSFGLYGSGLTYNA